MAEFCNKCANRFDTVADCNVELELSRLSAGQQRALLCEGCQLFAIMVDHDGKAYRGYHTPTGICWIEERADLV